MKRMVKEVVVFAIFLLMWVIEDLDEWVGFCFCFLELNCEASIKELVLLE